MLARFRALARRAASSRSASRSAATRCCAGPRRPASSAARARARGRRGLVADRPGRRRPRDRPRLQPAGLHAHVPAHDEARRRWPSWRSTRACSTASALLAARDLLRVRQRLHRAAARLSRHRRLLARAARRKPHLRRIRIPALVAQCAQRPVRAGASAAAPRTRSARASRCGSRAHGGHVGFPAGPLARPRARPCPTAVHGLARRARSERAQIAPWTTIVKAALQEVAQRAALLRLARARCARRLVHARRPHPGGRAVPARQGQPHRAREAARIHRAATTPPTPAAAGSSRTVRSASTSSSRPRRGSGGCRPTRRRASSSTSHTGCRRTSGEALARRAGRLFLASDIGLGIVHTLDMERGEQAVERGVWRPQELAFARLPSASACASARPRIAPRRA